MTATTIDTLELARELRAGGVDERPAAAIAQAIKRGVESTPAPAEIAQIKRETAENKTDIVAIKADIVEMKADIKVMKTDIAELKIDLAEFKAEVRTNQRWQKWALGFIVAALIGVFWNLLIISQKLAALTVMMERLAQ